MRADHGWTRLNVAVGLTVAMAACAENPEDPAGSLGVVPSQGGMMNPDTGNDGNAPSIGGTSDSGTDPNQGSGNPPVAETDADKGGGGTWAGPAQGTAGQYFACRYKPAWGDPECREFRGGDWDEASATAICEMVYTNVAGEFSMDVCDAEAGIGACVVDQGNAMETVSWITGGSESTVKAGCEGVGGGIWYPGTPSSAPAGPTQVDDGVMPEALDAMTGSANVSVAPGCTSPTDADSCAANLLNADGYYTFEPNGGATEGLALIPGGGVDARAYAPLALRIAEAGYLVIVGSSPIASPIDQAMADHSEIQSWFIGGHSLGGVVASDWVIEDGNDAEGLILWASFPNPMGPGVTDEGLVVASIWGSQDGLSSPDEVEAAKSTLPASTLYIEVEGGNHAQFGYYGAQDGDFSAHITRGMQARIVADATIHTMRGPEAVRADFAAVQAETTKICELGQIENGRLLTADLETLTIVTELQADYETFTRSKVAVDIPESTIHVPYYVFPRGNAFAADLPPIVDGEVWCKFASAERLARDFPALDLSTRDRGCDDVNDESFKIARSLTSADALDAFDGAGKDVSFERDIVGASGPEWLPTDIAATMSGNTLTIASPSLEVGLESDLGEQFEGVHYCKVWGPEAGFAHILSD